MKHNLKDIQDLPNTLFGAVSSIEPLHYYARVELELIVENPFRLYALLRIQATCRQRIGFVLRRDSSSRPRTPGHLSMEDAA